MAPHIWKCLLGDITPCIIFFSIYSCILCSWYQSKFASLSSQIWRWWRWFISQEILFSQDERTPAVIGCGGLGSLLLLTSFGICIWVTCLIYIVIVYFPKSLVLYQSGYFKGWSMVYPEYASLDRNIPNWGQCQQVPVVFAFVMLTINWVTERMHI